MGQCFGSCCHRPTNSRVHCHDETDLDCVGNRSQTITNVRRQAWTDTVDSNANVLKTDSSLELKDVVSEESASNGSSHHKLSSTLDVNDCDDVDGAGTSAGLETLSYEKMAVPVLHHEERHGIYNEQKFLTSKMVHQKREMISTPDDFEEFIRYIVVPTFKLQSRYDQKQFAVLLLVSEEELTNIKELKFHPSDPSTSKPFINNTNLSMPASEDDYHNYIVARAENDNFHAEEVIFNKLDQLWNGYLSRNNYVPPKCFILYSWNVPCTKCTDLIIESFNKSPYKAVNVIVAATAWWKREEHKVRRQNIRKMKNERWNYINIYPIDYE